jgi:TPR repeat protein
MTSLTIILLICAGCRPAFKHALATIIILGLILAAPVAAGPVEDAIAARSEGDYATALRLYHPLANQGDAFAQYNLGLMYSRGEGVPQNHDEAAKWFRLAANRGLASAQYDLGVMYSAGQGVPQDYVRALMWFNLAATPGYRFAAIERDNVAKRMTPAQIAEAQKLAREWRPAP